MKKTSLKFWKWLDGKKTIGGIALHIAWAAIHLTTKISLQSGIEGHLYIGSLTGTGAIHKVLKKYPILQNISKLIKK